MEGLKVTIGVPIYNVANYIERCAVSAFEQSYDNMEYVFVNDCTPDNSMEVLQQVIERYPDRKAQVKIINHEKNKGLAGARNTIVDNATGDFIMHLDSDDWFDKNAVEECVVEQQKGDYDIVSFDMLEHHPNDVTKVRSCPDFKDAEDMCYRLLYCGLHNAAGRLIRLSLYNDNNIRCIEGCNHAEDLQVTPRLAFYAKRISVLHEPIYHYDLTNESSYTHVTKAGRAQKLKEVFAGEKMLKVFFEEKGPDYKIHGAVMDIQMQQTILKYSDDKKEYFKAVKTLRSYDLKKYRFLFQGKIERLEATKCPPFLLWFIVRRIFRR